MRSVLIIFGIAIGIFLISLLITPRKDLNDNPAEVAYEKSQALDKKDRDEDAKAAALKAKSNPAGAASNPSGASSTTAPPPAASDAAPVAHTATAFQPYKLPAQGNVTAVLTVKDRGDVTLELFSKDAPKTVSQIAGLIKSGFYNGILVHRVEPGFVVQFGNPATKTEGLAAMEGEPSVPHIPFEKNSLKHEAGTLGIALTAPSSDTGTSQMFINLSPNHSLDDGYCVFGKVASGMDVVGKIQRGDVISKFVIK